MNLKDLAKKALQQASESGVDDKKYAPPPEPVRRRPTQTQFSGDDNDFQKAGSEDALDRRAFRKGGFSRAEKRDYAREKFLEDLVQPPKNPPPQWLNDPTLLPKKPPGRTEE